MRIATHASVAIIALVLSVGAASAEDTSADVKVNDSSISASPSENIF